MKRALVVVALLGCPSVPEHSGAGATSREPSMIPKSAPTSEQDAAPPLENVVFADRTSQGYLLLVSDDTKAAPTRDELAALVKKKLPAETDQPEVGLLLQLVAAEPTDDPQASRPRDLPRDLIALHIELLDPQRRAEVLPEDVLLDPVLTRDLDDADRGKLGTHRRAILLRADYRNEHGVRGLRLLQTLVRVVASDRAALVHDPDTRETMSVDAFTRRRLQGGFGNVAEQVAVVPFPDKLHGDPFVRLTTRGMRRFGSPDLELDGLPRDPALLQQATFMLHGLALQMAQQAEIDRSGLPVELDGDLTVKHGDIARAYAGGTVPRCTDCAGEVAVRVVPRAADSTDPQGHVVARVIAPRDGGAKPPADHPEWVRGMLARLLGPPA